MIDYPSAQSVADLFGGKIHKSAAWTGAETEFPRWFVLELPSGDRWFVSFMWEGGQPRCKVQPERLRDNAGQPIHEWEGERPVVTSAATLDGIRRRMNKPTRQVFADWCAYERAKIDEQNANAVVRQKVYERLAQIPGASHSPAWLDWRISWAAADKSLTVRIVDTGQVVIETGRLGEATPDEAAQKITAILAAL